jgi:hypothetical protein
MRQHRRCGAEPGQSTAQAFGRRPTQGSDDDDSLQFLEAGREGRPLLTKGAAAHQDVIHAGLRDAPDVVVVDRM